VGGTEPEWIAAEKKFEDTIKKHNKPRAGFGFGPLIKQNTEKGYASTLSISSSPCLNQKLTFTPCSDHI
jgi:hypothetical protein